MQSGTKTAVSSLIALLAGLYLYPYCITYGMWAATLWSPIPRALHEAGFHGGSLHEVLRYTDFVFWIVLALPTALLVTWLKPKHLIWYTFLATTPFYVRVSLEMGSLLTQPSALVVWLVVVPITVLLVVLVKHWVRPNNSFKPRPLRGSA